MFANVMSGLIPQSIRRVEIKYRWWSYYSNIWSVTEYVSFDRYYDSLYGTMKFFTFYLRANIMFIDLDKVVTIHNIGNG